MPVNDPTITYAWSPTTNLSSVNVSNPFCNSLSDIQYQLLITKPPPESCIDTLLQNVIELDQPLSIWWGYNLPRSGFKTPSKAQWLRCPAN